MRNIEISKGEHYHVFNRGVNKQNIFSDSNDYNRFLFLILYFQSPQTFSNINRISKEIFQDSNVQHSVLNIDKIVNERYTELVSFCLMPNHFHLIIKEEKEGGISQYMQRVLNAYTKYFNTKYEKSGHLFQGPYRAVHIKDNEQLLHLSAYVHRNPREMKIWLNKEDEYLYSSYMDFIDKNRWGELLSTSIVLDQFNNKSEYRKFVKANPSKSENSGLSF